MISTRNMMSANAGYLIVAVTCIILGFLICQFSSRAELTNKRREIRGLLYLPTTRLIHELEKMGAEGRCDEMARVVNAVAADIRKPLPYPGALESMYSNAVERALSLK